MTQFDEALAGREEKYRNWTDAELRADARGDVLRLLNVFTDVGSPSMSDIQAMHLLAETAGRLVEGDESPEWAESFPDVADAWNAMTHAFGAFVCAKAAGRYAVDFISPVFAAHRALARAVMAMSTSDEERQAIVSAMKK